MIKIGSQIEEIDIPALLLDLDIMEKNIQTMAMRFKAMPTDLRPHIRASAVNFLPIIQII